LRELFSKRNTSVPRALKRLCAKHRASAEAEVRENAKYTADSVLRSSFAGGGFAKPRLSFLKSFLGLFSAPQEGAGGMRGGNSFGFLAGATGKNTHKMIKSFYGKLGRKVSISLERLHRK
jgi:hypothetical protein